MSGEIRETCFGQRSLGFEACEVVSPEETDLGLACVKCLVPAIGQLRRENQRLKKQADIDTLTKIFGRHAFERMIEEQITEGEPFVLLFADIRNFGEANKREGHTGGDTMLITTAQFLTEQMRQDDAVVYRWGGDEFCIILAPSSEDDARRKSNLSLNDQAIAVKERLTNAYQKSFAIWAYNNNYEGVEPLGLNIDYSVWEPGMGSDELITKADPKHSPYS